tara:strand:+ start:258 stop:581 length:324 start_codon:yes stop_codon:yes gene_type:complete
MFKSNRGGNNYVDWGKVDRAPVEVISAIKGNLPHIIAQMPYNEQLELLGNYHMRTSDMGSIVADVKAALAADTAAKDDSPQVSLSDVVQELGNVSKILANIKKTSFK